MSAMTPAAAAGRGGDSGGVLPTAIALPVPVCVVRCHGGQVLAANEAWRRLGSTDALRDLFPAAAAALPISAPRMLRSLPLRSGAGDVLTWWDVALAPHAEVPGCVVLTAHDVTDAVLARREAESAGEASRAADMRLRLAAAAAGVGSWEWDLRANRLAWSPEQFLLHGLDPASDLPPTPDEWFSLVHPDDRPLVEAAEAGGMRRADGTYQAEFRIRRADGEWRWLLSVGRVNETGPDGRPARICGVNLDTTERRREQDLLREAAAQLRLAFGAAGVFAWTLDLATGRVVWSEGAEVAFGLPPGGFGGTLEAFRAMVLPEDLPTVEEALARALAGETPDYQVNFRMRRADGSVRWTSTRGVVVRDAAGRPLRVVGVDYDRTERLAAEKAAAEEREQLKAAVEAARVFAFEWDPATDEVQRTPNCAAILGYQREEDAVADTGRGYFSRIHPEDRDRFVAVATGLQPAAPSRRFLGHGRVAGAAGDGLRIIGVASDITDRREAEEEARRGGELLRTVIESTPDLVWVKDREGRIILANKAAITLLGGAGAVIGRDARDLIPEPDQARQVLANDARIMAQGMPEMVEEAFGGQIYQSIKAPLRDGRGEVVGLVGVSRDVTEERRTQAALEAGLERLRLAQAAAGIGIHDYDIASGLMAWDARMRELWGVPEDEAITYETFTAGVHPDDLPAVEAALARALDPAGAGVFEAEYRVTSRRDAAVRRVSATGQVTFRDGAPVRLVGTVRDVTARRAAEEALAASEARYRALVEVSPQVIWLADAAGRLSYASRAWWEHTGQAEAEVLGTDRWVEAIHPEDAGSMYAAWQVAVAEAAGGGAGHFALQFRLRRVTDGAWRWFDTRGLPERDAGGRVLRWIGAAFDIHDQKVAQQALAESEARLRLAQRVGGIGSYEWDVVANQAAYSDEYVALHGLPAGTRTEHSEEWLARLHPEDRERTVAQVADLAATAPLAFDYRILRPSDGAVRWISERREILRDANGRALRVIGSQQDVTERREAEQALAESEARFRAFVEAMPQIAFTATPDGRNDFANRRWYEFTGMPDGSGLHHSWAEALHPADRAPTFAAWNAALASGQPYEAEMRVRGADGRYRPVLTRAVPLRDEVTGAILRWFGTSTDISEIVAARDAAARAAEDLEHRVAERTRALAEAARELTVEMRRREDVQAALLQSQKLEALGQLTGGVAHDFNNLLAAIQGGYRLLEKRLAGDPKALDLVRHGMHAAERGGHLIAQLMAFVRREELRPALAAPAEVLHGLEPLIRQTAGPPLRCVLEVAEDVWPVLVDTARLETVLLNLVANSRDAMPASGTVTITARNIAPDEVLDGLPTGRDFVRIAVADTGTGMDPETLRRAAEPFFTTKPKGKGTGLGLASAHAFAAGSGGLLRLSSTPGRGTTAELILPRAAVAEPEEALGVPDERSLHGNATVMVVDDDDAVRPVTAALLRDLGYRVVEAASAEAAEVLSHLEGIRMDLLITDVVMGGAPGPVLAARLRGECAKLPVLYVTGHGNAAALDGAPVLRKPFTPAALGRAVLAALGRQDEMHRAALAGGLQRRLRRPALREAYRRWLKARDAAAGALPSPTVFPAKALTPAVLDNAFIAEVLPTHDGMNVGAAGFRLERVGRALEERLGRNLTGAEIGVNESETARTADTLGAALGGLCARCARSRAPLHDEARFDPGDGTQPVLLERLLLPLSADGIWVTHLLGVVWVAETDERPALGD